MIQVLDFVDLKLFTFLKWPSFHLLLPIFASLWTQKHNCPSKNQQCLAFWILFAMGKSLELALGTLLVRIPYLAHINGVVTLLLVVPDFSGALFVYSSIVKTSVDETPVLSHAARLIFNLESPINGQASDERDIDIYGQEETEVITFFEGEKRTEWSCSVCLISTTSEVSLKEHLNGERHKKKLGEMQIGHVRSRRSEFLSNLMNNELWWGELLHTKGKSIALKWEKPEIGWTKLNTDGSVWKTSAGIGGILRNSKGKPLRAFVAKIPHKDIFVVEMLAVWRGLVLARSLGVKAVWVESDADSVVKTINKKQAYRGDAEECLKLIWRLLRRFTMHQVTHLFREANRAADYLASMPTEETDVVLWPRQFPGGLWKIINDDCNGKVYHRKVGISLPWTASYG